MLRGRALACSLLVLITGVLVTSALGCKRDLGECNLDGQTPDGRPIDGPAAFDIAYRITDGLPMYEGQALVQSTCGDGSFCHAPAAVGADRIGVPAGLNFDVDLACTDESQDPSCAQPIESCEGGQTDTAYCSRLESLHNNQNQVNSFAEGMIQEMRAGAMPPGEAGRRVRNGTPWLRKFDPDRPNRPEELPPIESTEAQEIVRNWLACQAPVVARTEIPTSDGDELEPCPSVDGEICIYNGPAELPDPVWSDIYWSIMFTRCVVCHGPPNATTDDPNPDNPLGGTIPGGASPDALAALDLTGPNTTDTTSWPSDSYPAVVDALAADPGACAGQGTLVIPFDSQSSIMIEKLRGTQTCGTEMPPLDMISETLIQVVEEWVDLGAPNN
jgi:hypothetical protein